MSDYVELQVTTNFSFLRGASHPEEMVVAAAQLGYGAVGIADWNSVAGVVRAHVAAKQAGVRLCVGSRLRFIDGTPDLLCYPTDRAAWGRLTRLLSLGKRRAEKGQCHLTRADLIAFGAGQIVLALPPDDARNPVFRAALEDLRRTFKKDLFLVGNFVYRGDDRLRLRRLARLARDLRIPLVAANDVHAHHPGRRPVLDVVSCIREHRTLATAGYLLAANGERYLKAPGEMVRLFADYPEAVAHTARIADRCAFSLDELRYDYPVDAIPAGTDAQSVLSELSRAGAAERYPGGVPAKVTAQIDHELALIGQLSYAPYFLTVHDIVRFARSRNILCQGRGSAANSAVCYVLGITAVDPARMDLLFERFISAERDEPPDIDVDFEHERREEVYQYVYARYGRERAGLTAAVYSYRRRGAVREIGKVMGLSEDATAALAGIGFGYHAEDLVDAHIAEAGLDPRDPTVRQTLELAVEMKGFPRHLSQHSGGMVMTRGRLDELVPVENAAMADRTVIEWDKDDLDALGILKVDLLSLGMLTCVRKCFDLIAAHHGRRYDLATLPAADTATYDMLCDGDSLGVFQVESRAQMAMLPRLKPRNFYDLVIEVAIVRPGPIQGDMVHPFLRRRNGEETVEFPSSELAAVLGKTLGVPLFQEQAMKIAIVAAGFTPAEADALRRAMATFRKTGQIHGFAEKMIGGMIDRGYERDFAERCFKQIEGFADYGFPESHAASFALLVYVSAWLKRHYPAAFACALLNSQPMGFYAPAQIVRDARDHGVRVRPVDVNHSTWDCTLEAGDGTVAVRLGLRQVKGLAEVAAAALVAARDTGGAFDSPADLWRRAGLNAAGLDRLARADGFGSLGLNRRDALWAVKRLGDKPLPLFDGWGDVETAHEPAVTLPAQGLGEQVADDYRALRLSLRAHPLSFLRPKLADQGYIPAASLARIKDGNFVSVAGLVITRQRPGTAKGVIFVTLEDETGVANLIVWADTFDRHRKAVLQSRVLGAYGKLQRQGKVIHLVVGRADDLSARLYELEDRGQPPPGTAPIRIPSRDFH